MVFCDIWEQYNGQCKGVQKSGFLGTSRSTSVSFSRTFKGIYFDPLENG